MSYEIELTSKQATEILSILYFARAIANSSKNIKHYDNVILMYRTKLGFVD